MAWTLDILRRNATRRLLGALFALAVIFQSGCSSFRPCRDSWWGEDKAKHFLASAAIGAGAAALASSRMDAEESYAVGLTAGVLAGAGKEWADLTIKKTCWSWQDLVWDFLGASVGASVAFALE